MIIARQNQIDALLTTDSLGTEFPNDTSVWVHYTACLSVVKKKKLK
jgi:hypothetical protein